jgi:hypothetical protein
MYSKENVRTISHGGSSSSDESILDIENFSPIETFDKNINFINEKYNGQFNKTEVLLTLYPVDNKKVAIITFRDMSSSNENNLLMYLTTEKDAKRLIPNIQMAVDQNKKLSNGEMMACLSSQFNFTRINKDEVDYMEKKDSFGIDPNDGIQTIITEDFNDNFTEKEIEILITKAYNFFLDNKYKAQHAEYEIIKIKKNNKLFGILILYDKTHLEQVMLGTYKQVSKTIKDILKRISIKPNEDQQIEELNKLLEEYDCEDELQEIEDLDLEKWEQIQHLEELLEERITQKNAHEKIEKFKSLIAEYKHHRLLPPLPKKPHGSLFGIGFIYDEDMDTRVLMAIEILKDKKNIVAVHEHKGIIEIYSKDPCKIKEIKVCGDVWPVYNYLPKNGKWIDRSDIMSR